MSATYGVQASAFREGIDVGRVNPAGTAFLDKHDGTDMVLFAVAQYVLRNFAGGMQTTFPKAGLAIEIRVTHMDGSGG